MESLSSPHVVFNALRPLCVQLAKDQTVQNVQELSAHIKGMEDDAVQAMLDYILFPLRFSLKAPQSKKPRLLEAVLECMTTLFCRAWVFSETTLVEVFTEICSCLPSEPSKTVPETLRLSVVCTLHFLLSASKHVIHVLQKPLFLPQIGYTISLLLNLAEHDPSREIRLESLGTLNELILQYNQDDPKLSDLFTFFLPGILTTLAKIICSDSHQGYKLTITSLKMWAKMVVLVMADEKLECIWADPRTHPFPDVTGRAKDLLMEKDEFWLEETKKHISTHLDCITSRCNTGRHWKVKLGLVNLAHMLISKCWTTTQRFSSKLLVIIVAHINDERPEVKARANEALQEIMKGVSTGRALREMLSENLHSLAVTLPRLLSSQDDEGKLKSLNILIGYLQLLGPQLKITFLSQAHLQRLSNALLQTLELELSSVKLVEERLSSSTIPLGSEDHLAAGAPKKTFRFFRDQQVFNLIQSVCRLLGFHGDIYLMLDHFLGFYRAQRLPAVLILNQLVAGAAGLEMETLDVRGRTLDLVQLQDVVRLLLDEYTDPSNWHLYTCQDSDELEDRMASLSIGNSKKYTVSDINANAWKLCLQLEGISVCARALGESFSPLLITILYPVLEKAGDPSLMVSRTASLTLEDISVACRYETVIQFIEKNADYLASEVSIGLRRLHIKNTGAARVLHAMLKNCGSDLLPVLGELVQDLLPALDQSQDDGAQIIFPVLNLLVAHLGNWFPPVDTHAAPKLPDLCVWAAGHPGSLAQELQDFLQDHIEQQRLARGEVDEEEEEHNTDMPPTPPNINDESQEAPMPIHIKISKEVAERCAHFLAHRDPRIRLQALDTLLISLVSLQSQENVLLPLAHKVWPSLVKRLLQDEPLVLIRDFKVLVSLAASCKEFLRQRVCKDALPAFLTSLRSQAPHSCRTGPVYTHTMAFKLQLAVLEGLGPLCVALGLGDGDLLEVLDCGLLYLSSRQPKRLQEAASSVFLSAIQLDPDATWLWLCEWQDSPEVPHPSLIPLPWSGKANDEYTQNVRKLLQKLQ